MTERMLHRGWIEKVSEVRAKTVVKAVSSKFPEHHVSGVLSILLKAEWFRTTDSLVYTRVAETYDEKLESSFSDITLELVIPFIEKLDSNRWRVLFPNGAVELSTSPTELTIEHDNDDLLFKWSEAKQDYLRSARPELGGRILFFPPGEVLLVSIVEQPISRGLRVDVPRKRPARPSLAEYEQSRRIPGHIVWAGGHPKAYINLETNEMLSPDEVTRGAEQALEALFA